VVDGDTVVVEIAGQQFKVRYIGIDTPESVDPRRQMECFGKEASERNRELVEGMTVGLEKDVSETDAFGRLLRYVWLDGRLVNARLVTEGYALASTYPPDVRYSELFAELQTEARTAGLGLWGAQCDSPATTTGAETATQPPPGGATCEFSNSTDPGIKGNISFRTGEKIYHVPGGEFYENTQINPQDGEQWFCTEAEAVAAGWRRSMR
jgi:micrococcal nuclease